MRTSDIWQWVFGIACCHRCFKKRKKAEPDDAQKMILKMKKLEDENRKLKEKNSKLLKDSKKGGRGRGSRGGPVVAAGMGSMSHSSMIHGAMPMSPSLGGGSGMSPGRGKDLYRPAMPVSMGMMGSMMGSMGHHGGIMAGMGMGIQATHFRPDMSMGSMLGARGDDMVGGRGRGLGRGVKLGRGDMAGGGGWGSM